MAFNLSDIYIGDYSITQQFGARPDVYSARYGLKGHNGIDIGCPSLTLILSAADGFVSEIGVDKAGYGNYLKIVHDGYLTLYAHLNDIVVKKGDHVSAGQLIAHSNNTGFSDAPHLHFGVAPCDSAGVKTDPNNGFSGYIDPMNNTLCQWTIKNLTKPVDVLAAEETKIPVPSRDFTRMVAEGSSFRVVTSYLIQHGLNQFLQDNGYSPIDLESETSDPLAGENVTKFLASKINELAEANTKVAQTATEAGTPTTTEQQLSTVETPEQAATVITTTPVLTNLFRKLFTGISSIVFVQK
jgi:hypothetical protein